MNRIRLHIAHIKVNASMRDLNLVVDVTVATDPSVRANADAPPLAPQPRSFSDRALRVNDGSEYHVN
jgi:hypothetical protein